MLPAASSRLLPLTRAATGGQAAPREPRVAVWEAVGTPTAWRVARWRRGSSEAPWQDGQKACSGEAAGKGECPIPLLFLGARGGAQRPARCGCCSSPAGKGGASWAGGERGTRKIPRVAGSQICSLPRWERHVGSRGLTRTAGAWREALDHLCWGGSGYTAGAPRHLGCRSRRHQELGWADLSCLGPWQGQGPLSSSLWLCGLGGRLSWQAESL